MKFLIFSLLLGAIAECAVIQNFTQIDYKSSTTIGWNVAKSDYLGIELHPGDSMVFSVPKDYQTGVVRNVVLTHRKDSKFTGSIVYNDDGTYYDSQGAYDMITLRNIQTGYQEGWIAKKFAEPRSPSEPEVENLHDWVYYVGVFSTNLVTLASASQLDEPLAVANIHRVDIEFFPTGTIDSTQIEIYSPGTTFIDLAKGIYEPSYGGGPLADLTTQQLQSEGLYPGAVELGIYGGHLVNVSSNVYVDWSGKMHIKIPAGKILGGFEVSCGDTKYNMSIPPSKQVNKDGGYGALGWAKLSAYLSVSYEDIFSTANVPPSGVISGGPETSGYVVKQNEEIIVTSSSYSWVMGYKVTFMKSPHDKNLNVQNQEY